MGVVRLFGPMIHALVVNRLQQRDSRLAAEATKVVYGYVADGAPEATVVYVRLKTLLELQTILCTEYRCAQQPTGA